MKRGKRYRRLSRREIPWTPWKQKSSAAMKDQSCGSRFRARPDLSKRGCDGHGASRPDRTQKGRSADCRTAGSPATKREDGGLGRIACRRGARIEQSLIGRRRPVSTLLMEGSPEAKVASRAEKIFKAADVRLKSLDSVEPAYRVDVAASLKALAEEVDERERQAAL